MTACLLTEKTTLCKAGWRYYSLLAVLRKRRTQLKKILSVIWIAIALFSFALATPALAGDAVKGKQVFTANCNACHAGGKNLVNGAKTLKKADLEKYGMYSMEKIVAQVTNGKAAMPGFKGRLKPEQIDDVATYVLDQADKW